MLYCGEIRDEAQDLVYLALVFHNISEIFFWVKPMLQESTCHHVNEVSF
jgi:hypothetical protein